VLDKIVWVGCDIKAPFTEEHYKKATGNASQVQKVKESLQMLIDSNVHFECRTTCDPRILSIDDIYTIADTLADLGVKEYYLQKYRPTPTDKTTQDSDCEKFFADEKLQAYLKQKFEVYDVRK
jgi:pyruvate formate lyase activating enzyme